VTSGLFLMMTIVVTDGGEICAARRSRE
jgi:hypothetical protein